MDCTYSIPGDVPVAAWGEVFATELLAAVAAEPLLEPTFTGLSSEIAADAGRFTLGFSADLSPEAIAVLDGGVRSPAGGLIATVALHAAKYSKFDAIDMRTEALISNGFVYAGLTFSLSSNAQKYWLGMVVGKDLMTYPLIVNTLDDAATYAIQDANETIIVYATAMGTVKARLASGTTIKDLVRAAITIEAVMAIVDGR